MGFIAEAKIMLDAAEKSAGSKALQVGWLTLAKDTLSAALTEAKKGVKGADGHVPAPPDQPSLPFAARGAEVKVDGSGTVVTPADERAEPAFREWRDSLPDEATADTLDEHKRHVAADPSGHSPGCIYCKMPAAADAVVE